MNKDYMISKDKSSQSLIALTVIASVLFCTLNVLYFISQAASPLIRDDAWYFLDVVIRKWGLVGFDLSDLFVKRFLTDHAQPANKIALFINFKYFGLDFRIDSAVGFIGLLGCIFTFTVMYMKSIAANGRTNWLSALMFISALSVLTSLNSIEIYTWPLVTFGFLTILFFISISLLTWKYLAGESPVTTGLLLALLIILIGDTQSIILLVSLIGTASLFLLSSDKAYKSNFIKYIALSTAYVCTFFALINVNYFGYPVTAPAPAPASATTIDWSNYFLYIEALRLVFSSSVVEATHLNYFRNYSLHASWVVALIVFGFYVRYFFVLITSRSGNTIRKFLTTSILIYATVSSLAIAYGRIPMFGVDYLINPRYVLTYQLIPFALMMDYAFSLNNKKTSSGFGVLFLVSAATLLLFISQIFFTVQAYSSVESISRFQVKQAKAIGNYITNPSLPSGNCTPPSSTICNLSVEKRGELLNVLQEKRLNLLRSSFQWKYRLFPFDQKSPDLTLAQIDLTQITKRLSAPAFGGVDVINDIVLPKSGRDIPINDGKINSGKIMIAGYAVDAVKSDVAAGVLVLVDGKPYTAVYGGERPDIAETLNNPKYLESQFYVVIPTAEIGVGRHEVKFRVIANDKSGYYESDWLVKLDVK